MADSVPLGRSLQADLRRIRIPHQVNSSQNNKQENWKDGFSHGIYSNRIRGFARYSSTLAVAQSAGNRKRKSDAGRKADMTLRFN